MCIALQLLCHCSFPPFRMTRVQTIYTGLYRPCLLQSSTAWYITWTVSQRYSRIRRGTVYPAKHARVPSLTCQYTITSIANMLTSHVTHRPVKTRSSVVSDISHPLSLNKNVVRYCDVSFLLIKRNFCVAIKLTLFYQLLYFFVCVKIRGVCMHPCFNSSFRTQIDVYANLDFLLSNIIRYTSRQFIVTYHSASSVYDTGKWHFGRLPVAV